MTLDTDLRILLWDIDGTLIRSFRQGAYKDYTIPLLKKVFGTSGRLGEMNVSGMTDLQLFGEALVDEGYTHEQIRSRIGEIREHYVLEMRIAAAREELFQLLPGARESLQTASEHPRYLNALLTGNIEQTAKLKMELVGLAGYFALPGAFGDDSHDRRDLPALAASRIQQALGHAILPSQFIIIGDTPNDIACAKHFGARSVAVATGRSHSFEVLRSFTPDAILPNLADPALTIATFDSL